MRERAAAADADADADGKASDWGGGLLHPVCVVVLQPERIGLRLRVARSLPRSLACYVHTHDAGFPNFL